MTRGPRPPLAGADSYGRRFTRPGAVTPGVYFEWCGGCSRHQMHTGLDYHKGVRAKWGSLFYECTVCGTVVGDEP